LQTKIRVIYCQRQLVEKRRPGPILWRPASVRWSSRCVRRTLEPGNDVPVGQADHDFGARGTIARPAEHSPAAPCRRRVNSLIWAARSPRSSRSSSRPTAGGDPRPRCAHGRRSGGTSPYELASVHRGRADASRMHWCVAPGNVATATGGKELCDSRGQGAVVTVGPVLQVRATRVGPWVWRGCLEPLVTYRLDQQSGIWKVTGTVGEQGVS